MSDSRRIHLAALALLAGLTAVLYGPTLDDPWHFDDLGELTPSVRALRPHVGASHYRGAVARWSWAIDYRLYGRDPRGYHLTNLLIHLANASLVYGLAWMLASGAGARRIAALTSGATFCAHPLATQGVTYLTQRSTSLATVFFLLSLSAWVAFRRTAHRRGWLYATSLASLALGLHTKHLVLMLPAAIVVVEVLFPGHRARHRFALLLPFVLLVAWRGAEFAPRLALPPTPPSAARLVEHHSRTEYALAQPRSIATYARLFVFPRGQNLDWDLRPPRSPRDAAFVGPAAGLAALAAAAWVLRRRRPLATFGIALFLLALVPTSSLVPSADLFFEHRAYLPMAGLCLALGDAAALVHARRPRSTWVALAAVLAILGAATLHRNAVWDSELSLWSDVAGKSPNKARPHVNLGLAWQNAGRTAEAEREYRWALEIQPGHALALNNLGNVLRREGRIEEAERSFRRAAELRPRLSKPRTNLGNLAMDRGDFAAAESLYREALRLEPTSAEARYDLAKSLEAQGRTPAAIEEYEHLVSAYPDDALFANDLGCALLLDADPVGAERELRRAIGLKGNGAVAWYNLGLALEAQKRTSEAVAAFERALVNDPTLEAARARLSAYPDR